MAALKKTYNVCVINQRLSRHSVAAAKRQLESTEQRNIIKKLQEKVVNLESELSTAIADCKSARKRQDAAERLASGLQIEVNQLR